MTDAEILLSHDLFVKQGKLAYRAKTIVFSDELKSLVLRVVLENKIKTDIAILKQYVTTKNFNKKNKLSETALMIKELSDIINFMLIDADRNICLALQEIFGDERGEEMFFFIFEHEKGWRNWRKPRIENLFNKLYEYILVSKVFKNDVDRCKYFLTIIYETLLIVLKDIETYFSMLNGEIGNIIRYKGKHDYSQNWIFKEKD